MSSDNVCSGRSTNERATIDELNGGQTPAKKEAEMSFDDLSDIAIMQVMDKLDLRSRLSMGRVSKRMNGLQLQVKNELDSIQLNLDEDGTCESIQLHPCIYGDIDYNKFMDGLPRLLLNTHIQTIAMSFGFDSVDDCSFLYKFIEDFENFKAEEFELDSVPDGSLLFLVSLAEKFKKVSINTSISNPELCLIRKKMMMDGGCMLKRLDVEIFSTSESFMEECFGITVEEEDDGLQEITIYRYVNESGELYAESDNGIPSRDRLCHIEGDVKTTIDCYTITIEKYDGGAKPEEGFMKVKMNHPYECEKGYFDEEYALDNNL